MNKAQLIDRLSTQLGSKKAATDAVEAVIDTVTRAVASGERVAITGFGVFEKVARPARTGRNPRTGAGRQDQEDDGAEVQAGQSFKDVVSGAKKLPKVAASAARRPPARPRRRRRRRRPRSRPPRRHRPRRSAPAKKLTARKTTAKKTTARKTTARKRR